MIKRIFLLFTVAFLTCAAVSAQARLFGKVVEVIDGRTVVMETGAGRMNVQLQYVEVPEPGQPLNATVIEHLSTFALGRDAELVPVRILEGRTFGRLSVNGVDLSAQLILDGAAWHEPAESSGQAATEAAEYAGYQQTAKTEKRGIWAYEGLKAPWQLRKERVDAAERTAAVQRSKQRVSFGINNYQTISRPGNLAGSRQALPDNVAKDAWLGVMSQAEGEFEGVRTYSAPRGEFSVVYTSHSLIEFDSARGKQKLDCRALYGSGSLIFGHYKGLYALAFRGVSNDFNFSKKKSVLTVTVDNRTISLGTPLGYRAHTSFGAAELFYYAISKADLKKIIASQNVEFKVNGLSGKLPDDTRELFKQLIIMTE